MQVADSLGPAGPILLVAGGVAYSVGGLIYAVKWPDPKPKVFGYHEIFHMLVIVASALHSQPSTCSFRASSRVALRLEGLCVRVRGHL